MGIGEAITDGRKVVAAAGTAERLVARGAAGSSPISAVIITAETDNTGIIAVGASTVVATVLTRRGIPLAPGESVTISCKDLADIYIDATVTGDGVTFTALVD